VIGFCGDQRAFLALISLKSNLNERKTKEISNRNMGRAAVHERDPKPVFSLMPKSKNPYIHRPVVFCVY